MKPSPQMQQLIEQLAAKHGVDLSEPNRYLRLAIPDHPVHLIIETTNDRVVIVGCYSGDGTEDADPYMCFVSDYPSGWLPIDLLYSPQAWESFRQEAGLSTALDDVELGDLTEYWARKLVEQGWLTNAIYTTILEHAGAIYGKVAADV